MHYVKLGRTGLDVSRLCLGGMSFGPPHRGADNWTLSEDQSEAIIRRALDAGINFFDTANVYSDGASEEILGTALRKYGRRDELVVATKVFGPMRSGPNSGGLSRKAIITELDNSLRRLGTDYVDLYQLHRWDPRTPIEETLAVLHDAVTAGKVRYLGASSMFAWQFAKLQFTARANGWAPFVSMQDHYNLLNREEEREMLPLCADQGVGVLVWSPLARGRLAREGPAQTPRGADDGFGDAMYAAGTAADDQKVIEALGRVARARDTTRGRVALAWLLHNPVVTAPIVGVTSVEQLDDVLLAPDLVLSDDEVAQLQQHYVPHPIAGFE